MSLDNGFKFKFKHFFKMFCTVFEAAAGICE